MRIGVKAYGMTDYLSYNYLLSYKDERGMVMPAFHNELFKLYNVSDGYTDGLI